MSRAFADCMSAARAERPRLHCQAVEIKRLSAEIPDDRWKREVDERCEAPARETRGTLASARAQDCKIIAYMSRAQGRRGAGR